MSTRRHGRAFVRSFFTTPTAVEGEDTAEMLRKAIQLDGMNAPDVWVPDNEDATAPNMRDEGVENIVEVVAEDGADFPGEIHPRVVWHRDDPERRRTAFDHMSRIADPENGAIEYIDGFVIPEVGTLDDWKKADEVMTTVEERHDLEPGSLAMSVIIESARAELAMGRLTDEMGKPDNHLERLYLLVDGEVDYTKDMRAMTPTGELPAWRELRHNTSRAASAAGLIAVDGPYDDIRDVEGYRDRMQDNRALGMLGIWALTPAQVREANQGPLPPRESGCHLHLEGRTVELARGDDGNFVVEADGIILQREDEDTYRLTIGGREQSLDEDALREELLNRTSYIMSLQDIAESMDEFEAAKEAGRGAISMERKVSLAFEDVVIDVSHDRMWDEATYQAAQTPITLLQEVYETRPDQHADLEALYGADVIELAMDVG